MLFSEKWRKNMDLIKYKVSITPTFGDELEQIYRYMIYNLKEFPLYKDPNNVLSRYFEITTDYPSLFTIKDSNFCICTLEVKQAIEKMKISNVEFNEIYGLTKDECDALGLQLWEKNM